MLSKFHDLAIRLDPELSGNLELLRHREEWPLPAGALAYAIRGRHLGIRDELRRLGRWAGHWVAAIVFVVEPTIEMLLHELAHILPVKPPIVDDCDEPTAEQRGYQNGQLLAWAAHARQGEPWAGHDLKFIRRALHLAHRAESLGLSIKRQKMLIAGEDYGLSNVSDYADALASEPQRMSNRTFTQIEDEPLLPPFVRLFVKDASRWHTKNLLEQYQ